METKGIAETWDNDKKEVARLLASGRRLSMKRIKKLLPEGTKAGPQKEADPSSESFYNESSHFFKTTQSEDKRLQETLQQAKKGVKRMVRFLPEHEVF